MTRNLTYTALRPRFESLGKVPCQSSQRGLHRAENSASVDTCAILRGGYFLGYQVVAQNIEGLWLRCRQCRMTPPELLCTYANKTENKSQTLT